MLQVNGIQFVCNVQSLDPILKCKLLETSSETYFRVFHKNALNKSAKEI